ncbi:helix-turn-helix transcriptional regulator [Kaustia mangrovi]|uniref:Helix-turn-helix transcriptional regulator n=1 Tax=Kaustia mangrovi TaxID=2593653 RepID=A0A7S8C6D0_9HYPH|nr:helix-turn-helix domain-containing protein [Kaustia mangrovi]QPC44029.1 helix-turn-helix transcriptional regulator [Kaustia mangrovi]
MLNSEDIFRKIERHADACGYTVRGLFAVAGVSYANWHKWRNGVSSPTLATIERLLKVEPVSSDKETTAAS